jgi:hypothetical protein
MTIRCALDDMCPTPLRVNGESKENNYAEGSHGASLLRCVGQPKRLKDKTQGRTHTCYVDVIAAVSI